MPELQLIGGPQSPYVWVCRLALAEKRVAYSLIPVMPHTPEVDAIHPFGKIPVLRHGEVRLCESRAICFYIDRVFDGPPLVPTDPSEPENRSIAQDSFSREDGRALLDEGAGCLAMVLGQHAEDLAVRFRLEDLSEAALGGEIQILLHVAEHDPRTFGE